MSDIQRRSDDRLDSRAAWKRDAYAVGVMAAGSAVGFLLYSVGVNAVRGVVNRFRGSVGTQG